MIEGSSSYLLELQSLLAFYWVIKFYERYVEIEFYLFNSLFNTGNMVGVLLGFFVRVFMFDLTDRRFFFRVLLYIDNIYFFLHHIDAFKLFEAFD